MIRIVAIDDDPFVCQSLATILGAQEDLAVAATGTSGPEAVALFFEHEPDVLLLDIQMPGGDGLAAAQRILGGWPDARIVFLTTFADNDYIARALALGAKGYLIKHNVADIAPAVRAVAAGQCVLGGEVVARLSANATQASGTQARDAGSARAGTGTGFRSGKARGADSATGAAGAGAPEAAATQRHGEPDPSERFAGYGLTGREIAVVEQVAAGLDNTEIAAELHMSEGTVRNHISSILRKLGLRNRTQLAVLYYRPD